MYLKLFLLPVVLLVLNAINASENQNLSVDGNIWQFSENDQAEVTNLDEMNLRGLGKLFQGEFADALADFNHILNVLYNSHKTNEPLFGAALWGRLLCHAYADNEEEAFNDLSYIRTHFMDNSCYPCLKPLTHRNSNPSESSDYRIMPIADFANPTERITPEECKNRVRGTANIMRILVTKIPSRALGEAVSYTITELEYAAYRCCDRAHWTECLTPIADSWNYLKNCMDKGVAIAPKLASPGR